MKKLKNLLKKSLVLVILLLFVVVYIIPCTSKLPENISYKNFEYDKNYIDTLNGNIVEGDFFDEPPGVQWIKIFGEASFDDQGYEVRTTSDGGLIIVGLTGSYSSDHCQDGWLIKTDEFGVEEWNNTYGEPGGLKMDFARSVYQTFDGGYAFTGTTYSYSDDGQVWFVKTDANGNEEVNRVYGPDRGYSIHQTNDGGFVIVGDTYNLSILLLKVDGVGNELWRKNFWGYPGAHGSGYSVDETFDGGVVLTGDLFYVEPDVEPDVFLVKTDNNGTELFNVTFSGKDIYARGESVRQTDDGGFIITGYIRINETSNWLDAWLIKTDEYGNEQWNKTFGETPDIEYFGNYVIQTNDSGYAIAGYSETIHGEYSGWLIKTDAFGNKEWQVNIPFTQLYDRIIWSLDQTVDGGFVLAGKNSLDGIGDVLLIKIAPEDAPKNPIIKGLNKGKPGQEYEYTFVTVDPDGEQVYYWVDWGDGNDSGWIGPFDSGVEINESHIWSEKGKYIIQAKAKDVNGKESGWGTLAIKIPRNKISTNTLFLRFLERYQYHKKYSIF